MRRGREGGEIEEGGGEVEEEEGEELRVKETREI